MAVDQNKLKYTKDHEWISLDGKKGIIGITEYAAEQLGDVVHVELPQVGQEFEQGDTFGSVESVKSVSDLYIPVTGRVIEVNDVLLDNSEIINEDPLEEGWLIKIETDAMGEYKELMTNEQYQSFLSEEA